MVGCGASGFERKKMFDELKTQGVIDVGDLDYNDYSETEYVSYSPVPGGYTMYLYETEDYTYGISFQKYKDVETKKRVYRAYIETRDGDEVLDELYYYFD